MFHTIASSVWKYETFTLRNVLLPYSVNYMMWHFWRVTVFDVMISHIIPHLWHICDYLQNIWIRMNLRKNPQFYLRKCNEKIRFFNSLVICWIYLTECSNHMMCSTILKRLEHDVFVWIGQTLIRTVDRILTMKLKNFIEYFVSLVNMVKIDYISMFIICYTNFKLKMLI